MVARNHIYRLFAKVVSIHLDGTATINFLKPATGFSTTVQIPQDDFGLGDIIVFEIADILDEEEFRGKYQVEGELISA